MLASFVTSQETQNLQQRVNLLVHRVKVSVFHSFRLAILKHRFLTDQTSKSSCGGQDTGPEIHGYRFSQRRRKNTHAPSASSEFTFENHVKQNINHIGVLFIYFKASLRGGGLTLLLLYLIIIVEFCPNSTILIVLTCLYALNAVLAKLIYSF